MRFSILDLVTMWNGETASQAIANAVALARHAEQLGYTRYWFAEHHNAAWQASSAPELLIAHTAAATTQIRVGSGGVMLPNHSPLKVAENFRTLEAMHPGRIDLGIGRAPGTDGMTALALRRSRQALISNDFAEQLEELNGFLYGTMPLDHRFYRIVATPVVEHAPEIWMLASSEHGAAFAAEHGMALAFAHHINPEQAVPLLQAYRRDFQPSPQQATPYSIFATAVFCAESEAAAEDTAAIVALFRQRLGRSGANPPTLEEARAYRQRMADLAMPDPALENPLIGAAERVTTNLRALAEAAQADEVMALTFTTDQASRLHSYTLLAEALRSA